MIDVKTTTRLLKVRGGVNQLDMSDGVPTHDELIQSGWTPVSIYCEPERLITACGFVGFRKNIC